MAEKGLFALGSSISASGAAFGWLNPPQHMRQWMLDCHKLSARSAPPLARSLTHWLASRSPTYWALCRYCRELTQREATRRDIRRDQREYRQAQEDAEVERLEKNAREQREKDATSRDWEVGMIRTRPCPDMMPTQHVEELKQLVQGLYGDTADSDEMTFEEMGQVLAARDQARLRALIAEALIDTDWDYDQWAEDFGAELPDDYEATITAVELIRSLNELDGTDPQNPHLGWPTACKQCSLGCPCARSGRRLGPHEQLLATMLTDVDLSRRSNRWNTEVVLHTLRKRNLQRFRRPQAAFDALVAAQVWPAGSVPSEITAPLPVTTTMTKAELVVLLMRVLRAEAISCHPWDVFDAPGDPGDPVGDYNDSHDIIATLPDEPEAVGMELAH